MIRKIFIEKSNDERTNALKLILDIEKIPYNFIEEAREQDFKEGLFLLTTKVIEKADYRIILNPELLKRPLKVNQAEELKLKVQIDRILNVLKEFNLSDEINMPYTDVYKEIEINIGETLSKIKVDRTEYPALSKEGNKVYFFFDILTLFINLISENYFEKLKEKHVLSNTILGKLYKNIPYFLRIPIYRNYYKRVHKKLENENGFKTEFPVDATAFALLELIKYSILLQTDLVSINRWPSNYNNAVLLTHDTEPSKFSYTKGLRLMLNKLKENNIKSTFTLVASYVKYINNEDLDLLKQHEIGCHDLYHDRKFLLVSKEEREKWLKEAKAILEKKFERKIEFFRAPTLQRPSDLFDSLEKTGYKYDSSIIDSQREQPYCGKGNSFYMPFFPILNNNKSKVLELTISAPDCISPYFFGYSMDETLELFRKKIKFIERVNGLGVFIIHTPAWGFKDAEKRLMLLDDVIKNTKNSWMTTIGTLTNWWDSRSNLFLELEKNKIYLVNKNNFDLNNFKVNIESLETGKKEIIVEKVLPNEKVLLS